MKRCFNAIPDAIVRTVLVACAAAPLFASPAQAQSPLKLTLGYSGANVFMAAFGAKDEGFFAKRGMDVTLQLVPIGLAHMVTLGPRLWLTRPGDIADHVYGLPEGIVP